MAGMEQPCLAAHREPLPPIDESRRALRKAVKMRAQLRDRGTTKFEIDVVDLSLSGFRAETSFSLQPGNTVWLTLPGLAALEAVVAWKTSSVTAALSSSRCTRRCSTTSWR
jgi:hypothetical protein